MGELDESNKFFRFDVTRDGDGDYEGHELNEKRSLIFSVNGSMKISADVNLEVFKIGTELGAGFVIQSTTYTYTYYNVQGTITLDKENLIGSPSYQMNTEFMSTGMQKE
jgi:hypothetical protein